MRLTTEQKFRLGIFWISGGILTALIFGLVLSDTFLQSRDNYYIEFVDQPVSGLQEGSSVLYQGIQVGRVEGIRFDREEPRRVTVELSLRSGVPIKSDVEAQLTMTGITGGRQIELIGGSRSAELLDPGDEIPVGASLFDDITGDARVIISKLEQTLNSINDLIGPDNRQRVRNILGNVDELINESSEPLTASLQRLNAITASAEELAASTAVITRRLEGATEGDDFDAAVAAIYQGAEDLQGITGQVRQLTSSPEWQGILGDASATAERTAAISQDIEALASAISEIPLADLAADTGLILEQFSTTFNRMDMTLIRSSRDLTRSMEILNEILEDLSEFSRLISEDPSTLIQF